MSPLLFFFSLIEACIHIHTNKDVSKLRFLKKKILYVRFCARYSFLPLKVTDPSLPKKAKTTHKITPQQASSIQSQLLNAFYFFPMTNGCQIQIFFIDNLQYRTNINNFINPLV